MESGPVSGAANPIPSDNRRQSERFAIRLKGTAWLLARISTEPIPVETTDISEGGVMVHTTSSVVADLNLGDAILLGFPVDKAKEQLAVRGKLAWKRQGLFTLLGHWSFGVEFDEPGAAVIAPLLAAARAGEGAAGSS